MAAPIKPVAQSVYVCDDAIRDPASGKVSVLNLWDSVRVPADDGFPYRLKKLCVFVWWRDGLGESTSRVDVVQASEGRVVLSTNELPLRFARRTNSVYAKFMIENCVFPEPGYYYVEVFCNGEFIDDQIIRVFHDTGA